jgi:hypothetical protein
MSKCTLDFPAVAVSPHSAPVVGAALWPAVSPVRSQEIDTDGCSDGSQGIAVVRLVPDDDRRPESRASRIAHLRQHRFDELGFSDRGRRTYRGERRPLSTHDELGFRALPALRKADSVAPFFAARKVASTYVSCRSSRPRSSRTPSSASQAARHIPCFSQAFRRRQQVTPLGNGGGKSLQRAPDLNTQMIPSRHSRLPRHGRPRLSLRVFGVGNMELRNSHCSSVKMLERRFAIPQRKPWPGQKYKYHGCTSL